MATDADPLRAIARRLAPLIRKNPSYWTDGIRRWANDPPFFDPDGILPVPLRDKVTLDERIALLSAIYDCCVIGVARINPWHDPENLPDLEPDSDIASLGEYRLAIRYEILVNHRVPEIRKHWDTHEEAIEIFIAEAAEALAGSPSTESSADVDDNNCAPVTPFDTPTVSIPNTGTQTPKNPEEDDGKIPAIRRLLQAFTNGLADTRIQQAVCVLDDDKLTVHEKLVKIASLLPFPATTSAEKLGKMIGVSKQAVMKTAWWIENRKGEKDDLVGRRREKLRERAMNQDPLAKTEE